MHITDRIFKHPHFGKFQNKFFLNLPFWIAASITALVSVFYNQIFKLCEEFAMEHASGTLLLYTAPVVLLVSFLIGHFFSKESIGSGIPQVIASVELAETNSPLLRKLLGFKMLVAKIVGSCVVVLGGGVTGREGPTLQVSGAIFYQLARFWPKKWPPPQLPAMLLAGGAAGIASAFNTPLGGVVFAVEELSKAHVSIVRTSVFQGVIIAGILAQLFLGNYLYLGDFNFGTFPSIVLLHTLIIGGLIGIVGAMFAEGLYKFMFWRSARTLRTKILVTLACGLLLSLTIWTFGPSTIGSGKHVMVELLNNPLSADPFLFAARILGNIFTYCAGVIGGIFAPSLASGAALGQLLATTFGFESVKLMVLVGMVAFLTGVTRTPFTSFVLVLEMSNSHDVILYLMLSSLVANVTARIINSTGFYEQASHDIVSRAP